MLSPFQGLSRWLTRPAFRIPAIALLLLTPMTSGWIPQARAQAETEGVEVLTRGPVHEAFATTINFKATEGLIAPQAPSEAIQELPPDQRPEGDNVTWIPGYWSWDDETSGFLWVSGIWRNLPPGRQWIPGYWWGAEQGYQWISGYWADAETEEVEYLSEPPPASLEAGPNVAAPSKSHSWVPGTWRWSESRYAWQPGYWYEAQPEWVWVPPYYTWAPQGWLYVDGYYDYDMARRGLVFAPVRFSIGYTSRPNYFYRPTTVISLSVFTNHLFLRPRNRHYYFGDYYAPRYRQSGYFASFNYFSGGHGYDPIYSHDRWTHRDDDRWERRQRDDFDYYRDNESARPRHTYAAMRDYRSRPDRDGRASSDFATRLDQLSERRDSPIRLRRLGEDEQKTYARRGQEIRDFGDQRRKLTGRDDDRDPERRRGNSGDAKRKPEEGKSVKTKMPKSPVMARAGEGTNRPPRRPGTSVDRERSTPGADRGKSGDKNDRDDRPESPRDRADNKDRRTPKGENKPDSPADRGDPRRGGGKGQVPKPRVERKEDSVPNKPTGEPRGPVKEKSKPDRKTPGNRESNPQRETRLQPREEGVEPRRRSESAPSPQRESKAKKAPSPPEERRRATPQPRTQTTPTSEPTAPRTREPKSEPKRESRSDPKRTPKATPRAEPKREPKAEPRRESPSPPRKESKASPRPSPKTPAPAPQRPKKGETQPESEKDKKKKKAASDGSMN